MTAATLRAPLRAALFALLVVLLAACAPADAAPTADAPDDSANPPADAETEAPAPEDDAQTDAEATPQAGNVFTIENDSGTEICFVYVAHETAPEWGPNQLGEGETIADGATREFTSIPLNNYDILLGDCDEELIAQASGVVLGQQPVVWGIGPLIEPTFVNEGENALCELHVSPSLSTSWGPELLEGEQVEAGAELPLGRMPQGMYDIRTVTCSGDEAEVYGVAITGESAYQFGGAPPED